MSSGKCAGVQEIWCDKENEELIKSRNIRIGLEPRNKKNISNLSHWLTRTLEMPVISARGSRIADLPIAKPRTVRKGNSSPSEVSEVEEFRYFRNIF